MIRPHALYRFYDAAGQLLYIGITLNPAARLPSHRTGQPWWTQVATITLEHHPHRQAVLAAEKAAIVAERPRYNIQHNQRPTPPPQPTKPAPYDDEPPLTAAEIAQIERALATPGYWGRVL